MTADRLRVLRAGRMLVADVGTGDGRWVYESARGDPGRLYAGLDPDAAAMADYAYRASRKPSRGGVPNVVFVVGSIEAPPPELQGLADEVRVIFPWSALLRGILRAEPAVLRGLALLSKPEARFEMILTYDATHDRGAGLDAAIPSLDLAYLEGLRQPFAAAGLQVGEVRRLTADEALAIPSTWGRRLLHGRPRDVFLVRGTAAPAGEARAGASDVQAP